jgi:hypothetical protein
MSNGPRLSRRHAWIAGVVILFFAVLTLIATRSPVYAVEIALGPFAGAVARDWEGGCARDSWSLAPYAVSLLLAGFIVQVLVPPGTPWRDRIRGLAWWLACVGWCCFGVRSYLVALE